MYAMGRGGDSDGEKRPAWSLGSVPPAGECVVAIPAEGSFISCRPRKREHVSPPRRNSHLREAVMKTRLGLLSLIFLSSTLLVAQQGPASDLRPFAFTHVTVIDATGVAAQPDMTVVVSGDRITELGKTGQVAIPRNALVTDATNQFMIPGLWDMHTHVFIRSRKSFPLYVMYLFLANGVTGVRDMGTPGVRDDFGDFPYLQDLEWRQAISAGAILGPRLNLSLTIIDAVPMPPALRALGLPPPTRRRGVRRCSASRS